MNCRCQFPELLLHAGSLQCFTCGLDPRDDLGGHDDLARVKYRAKLNALREKLPKPGLIDVPVPEHKPGLRQGELRVLRVKAAKKLREQGVTIVAIAKRLGVSRATVHYYLNDEAWKRHVEKTATAIREDKEAHTKYRREWVANNREKWNAYQRDWRARKKAAA